MCYEEVKNTNIIVNSSFIRDPISNFFKDKSIETISLKDNIEYYILLPEKINYKKTRTLSSIFFGKYQESWEHQIILAYYRDKNERNRFIFFIDTLEKRKLIEELVYYINDYLENNVYITYDIVFTKFNNFVVGKYKDNY
jgi:hypothetical protein